LAERFKEKRLDLLHKESGLPVAQHFNGPGHSLEVVRVAVLKSGLAKKDIRQHREMTNARASRDKSQLLISIKSQDTHARILFSHARFQNSTQLQIAIS